MLLLSSKQPVQLTANETKSVIISSLSGTDDMNKEVIYRDTDARTKVYTLYTSNIQCGSGSS